MMYPAHYGALTQLWAGTSPEGLELNGQVVLSASQPIAAF